MKIIHEENGNKYYYIDNRLHKEDGPACQYADGSEEWYLYGKRHRIDGPAITWTNGDKDWYYQGTWIKVDNQKDFEKYLRLKAFW